MRAIYVVALLALLAPLSRAGAETIAAYGDSLTAGGDWFPWMPPEWTMVDHGIAGQECFDNPPGTLNVVGRLLADLATPGHPTLSADAVVIFCGTNDVRKVSYSEAFTVGEIFDGVDATLAVGIPVVVVAPPPTFSDCCGDTFATFNARLASLRDALFFNALAYGFEIAVADVYQTFWDEIDAGTPLEDLFNPPDFVHPWGFGRQLEAETIEPALRLVPEPDANLMLAVGILSLVAIGRVRGQKANGF